MMDLEGVVPAAVPLEPGRSMAIAVPRETHLMYWTSLRPTPAPPADRSPASIEHELVEFQRDLLSNADLQLRVDGKSVPLLTETNDAYGIDYWTVADPLPVGDHTLELEATYEPGERSVSPEEFETALPGWAPPPTHSLPDRAAIPWGDGTDCCAESLLSVVDRPPSDDSVASDPLWDRKDVYPVFDRCDR
jgi:hypothetical protein